MSPMPGIIGDDAMPCAASAPAAETTMALRQAAEKALEALETCTPGDYSTGHVIHPHHDEDKCAAAEEALRAALAAPEQAAQPLCACKDRALSACPGEWEPGCDLGNNPAHVRIGQRAAPVALPFTPAQRRRLYENSPAHHADATSRAAFERIVTLTERAHCIGAQP